MKEVKQLVCQAEQMLYLIIIIRIIIFYRINV